MPVYEFECQSGHCEPYEVWRTIDNRSTDTNCPQCGSKGKRVFSAPMTLSSSLRLKKESAEPTMVRRETVESKRPRLRQGDSRPWMLNRGC